MVGFTKGEKEIKRTINKEKDWWRKRGLLAFLKNHLVTKGRNPTLYLRLGVRVGVPLRLQKFSDFDRILSLRKTFVLLP